MNSHQRSHTHLQFAQANTHSQNYKRVCLDNAQGYRRNEETPVCNKMYNAVGRVAKLENHA